MRNREMRNVKHSTMKNSAVSGAARATCGAAQRGTRRERHREEARRQKEAREVISDELRWARPSLTDWRMFKRNSGRRMKAAGAAERLKVREAVQGGVVIDEPEDVQGGAQ